MQSVIQNDLIYLESKYSMQLCIMESNKKLNLKNK
jgi:hypothetical protein